MTADKAPMTAADEVRAYLSTPVTPKRFGRELVKQLLAEYDAAQNEIVQLRAALAAQDKP